MILVDEVHKYKRVRVHFSDLISFTLNIPWKWNNLVSVRPNCFILIGYLIAWWGWRTDWIPKGSATVMRSWSLNKHWAILTITGNTTEWMRKFKGHYLENSLIWMNYPSALLTVWFSAHFMVLRSFYTPPRFDFLSNIIHPFRWHWQEPYFFTIVISIINAQALICTHQNLFQLRMLYKLASR